LELLLCSWKVRLSRSSCDEMSSTEQASGEVDIWWLGEAAPDARPEALAAQSLKSWSEGAACTSIINEPSATWLGEGEGWE